MAHLALLLSDVVNRGCRRGPPGVREPPSRSPRSDVGPDLRTICTNRVGRFAKSKTRLRKRVVRQTSAKPLFGDSIPPRASNNFQAKATTYSLLSAFLRFPMSHRFCFESSGRGRASCRWTAARLTAARDLY